MRVSTVIREQREAILNDWEDAVRHSNSASATFSREDLRDDVPLFLDRLADWLDSASTDTSGSVDRETTGKHALHRLERRVELRHLIHEFRLLRQVILRHLLHSTQTTDDLRPDLARLADAMDHAMTESVSTYASARDEAREMMLAILGHDMRNPLSAISLAATSLLKAGTLNEVESRAVARIARSADRIRRMILDLLDLTRSRFGGAMPMKLEWMDLGEVAYYAVEELQLANPERRVMFERKGDLQGKWDRDRMGQLVSNLVGNAIRHGRDPVTIAIDGTEDTVEIRVANRGEAIPRDTVPTLFEPFRRGAAHDGGEGLGLGLFIVAEIVRARGGTIAVHSDDEETVFTVRFRREPQWRADSATVGP